MTLACSSRDNCMCWGFKHFGGNEIFRDGELPCEILATAIGMTQPQRKLEDKDVEWCWLEQREQAFKTVKEYLSKAPVLAYYDITKEVKKQCEASETGLDAVLLQEGQPIAYVSRAWTETETRYAQIEKELLAIVWATHKFDQYILGREIVRI